MVAQKAKKRMEEDKMIATFKNPFFKFLAYIFRFHTKEILFLVVLLMIGYYLAANVSYSKDNGLKWVPSIKTDVKVGH